MCPLATEVLCNSAHADTAAVVMRKRSAITVFDDKDNSVNMRDDHEVANPEREEFTIGFEDEGGNMTECVCVCMCRVLAVPLVWQCQHLIALVSAVTF